MLSEEELRRLIESLSIREIIEPALDKWIAYDNTTGDCWVEEFKTRREAREYCLNE